jgi:predicted phosphodiesterase
MKKICTQCGKEFEAIRNSTKYCSKICFVQATRTTLYASKTQEERIVVKLTSDVPITIAVLADAHNDVAYIQSVVDEVQKHDNWFVMINGDLWDADQYSSHPTLKVKSLADSVNEIRDILFPIADKIIGFVWGNHEERCFRNPSGKGTMPSYFDVFFNAIKAKNPDFQYATPMQSFIVEVTVKGKLYRILFKHGKSSGKAFGIIEFRDVLEVNDKVDVIVLSHVHLPMYMPVKLAAIKSIEEEEESGNDRIVHFVRTTAGEPFFAYQDKGNMFVSPVGLTKLIFNGELKVELR